MIILFTEGVRAVREFMMIILFAEGVWLRFLAPPHVPPRARMVPYPWPDALPCVKHLVFGPVQNANVHAGTFDIRGFEMQVMHFPPTSRPASTSFLGHQRLVQRSGDTKQMAAPRRTQRWSNICVGLSRWESLMSYGFRHSMRQP
jgi:hypothetical protein